MNPTVSPVDKREKNKRERERGGGERTEREINLLKNGKKEKKKKINN
jgi:hypothetical protein